MATLMQLTVILSILMSFTVSSDVFKVVGSSLEFHLDEQNTANFKELKWMFNNKFMLKYTKHLENVHVYRAYEGRVEFNKTTFDMTLKNLTKNDTGKYTVKIDDLVREIIIAENTLTVLDPVLAPNLTYSRPQQSNGTCNVSCESQNLSASTYCSNETCETNHVTSSNLTLFLLISGSTVICNVSNKAMSRHTTLNIKLCFPEEIKTQANHSQLIVLGSVGVVIIVIVLFIVYKLIYKKRKTGFMQLGTTGTTSQNMNESSEAFKMNSVVQKSAEPPSSGKNSQNVPDPELSTGQRHDHLEGSV
ncbi:uncharacterized protein LOC143483004 [Brachyhypopomus gauderio]|uniref:uncharacterized protein LOC143483004 n=1 Tax=Brachyhypopomus gauderio TaxID=698409 RepID=UPI0040431C54